MKRIEYTQLLKTAGTFEGVISAATCGSVTIDQVQNAERWAHAAIAYGLTVAGSRSDAATLRKLTESGYLTTSGMTNGKAHKLTPKGWLTASAWTGCSSESLHDLLRQVSTIQAKSKVTMPGDKQTRLCMTWHLVPSCGAWLSSLRTPAAREKFRGEVSEAEGCLVPLIALGWLTRFVATSGRFWAVTITDEGKAAMNDWPEVKMPQDMPPADSDAVYQAWVAGYERGKTLARTTPPDAVKNTIARLLPATSWM